jgi:hypothetical protein
MAFGKKKREQAINLVEHGSRGVGVVLSVEDTGMSVNDNPRVRMRFRVEPLDGSPPFEAEKKRVVSRVQIPRAGERYPVWYDPSDPEKWAYATVDDEQGRQSLRQMFGAAAETFTGVGDPMAAVAAAQAQAAAPAPAVPDAGERLRKLTELRTAGLLTDEEFEQKKAEILAQI